MPNDLPMLEAYFSRIWLTESGPLCLSRDEAVSRYRRFITAAYDAPDIALVVAEEGVSDLAIRREKMLYEIDKLLKANNPSRACKLYAAAMTSWTVQSDRGIKVIVVALAMGLFGALACLCSSGILFLAMLIG